MCGPVAVHTSRSGTMTKGSATAILACFCALVTGCRSAPEPLSPPEGPTLTTQAPAIEYFGYCMQKGDTLYSIGQRFQVSWNEIARVNHLERLDDLAIGTLLVIRRMPGVAVPELELPTVVPRRTPPRRSGLRPQDLHRGKPASAYWWPTQGRVVRRYGQMVRGLPEHGIGIAAPAGTEVCAVAAGTVVTCVRADAARSSAWGCVVAVSHAGNVVSWYACLGEIAVEKGEHVTRGEPIGTIGAGADDGELAFRLFRNNRLVDPEDYLP